MIRIYVFKRSNVLLAISAAAGCSLRSMNLCLITELLARLLDCCVCVFFFTYVNINGQMFFIFNLDVLSE